MNNSSNWGDSTLSGVSGSDLRLVRTSPHINRWESDGNGSLIIKAREDSETYSRSTTHFTLNSTVQDHSSGTFSGGRYATVSSLSSAAEHNIVAGIGTVDTWMLPTDGKITLPGATLFAPEGEDLPERFKGINTIRYVPDQDASKNYANLSSAIEADFKKNNLPTFDVGSYGWQGAKQPTKEELSKISSLVGSNTILPSIHFGSPDESMEALISDTLKLKQYTIGDVFSPSENSPMQQLAELQSRLDGELDTVHPKAKEMYREKFNKSYSGTKSEVDKWLDKKFPPHVEPPPISMPPPLPITPGSAIPPPIPSSSMAVPPPPPPVANEVSTLIDTPTQFHNKSSEWIPRRFSEGLSPHQSKDLLEVYEKHGGRVAQDTLRQVFSGDKNTTHQGVDKTKQSGVDTKTSTIANHKKAHKDLQENSVKNFFGNKKLKSFDTETTGLDSTNTNYSKRSKIWQLGLAIEGASGVEEHTSPFFSSNADGSLRHSSKMAKPFVESSLKHSNGRFSEQAFEQGNFNTLVDMYGKNTLSSLETSLNNTLGKVNSSDVVVLQNMNFENQMLKSSFEQGLIGSDQYQALSEKMYTVDLNKDGSVNTLFQRPARVQSLMRQADMLYHTEYLNNLSEDSFQIYREKVNGAIAEYSSAINNEKRVGAVAFELQDLSKAFLANGANRGLLDKSTVTLGLNVDFLSRAILGRSETHTALQDSEDTLDLFRKMWSMNAELESGVELSPETNKIMATIKEQQPSEINKRFISSVRSVINDYKDRGYTNIGDKYTWYNPEVTLKEKTTDGAVTSVLEKLSTTSKRQEPDFKVAMNNVVSRFSRYTNNIEGVDREAFVGDIVKDFDSGADFKTLHKKVDNDYFNHKTNLSGSATTENVISEAGRKATEKTASFWDESTTLFGKEMKNKTKATILGGIGVGLATMAFTTKPEPNFSNSNNVSDQFYDEQYLGTAFVDFKERNKHYMM